MRTLHISLYVGGQKSREGGKNVERGLEEDQERRNDREAGFFCDG